MTPELPSQIFIPIILNGHGLSPAFDLNEKNGKFYAKITIVTPNFEHPLEEEKILQISKDTVVKYAYSEPLDILAENSQVKISPVISRPSH